MLEHKNDKCAHLSITDKSTCLVLFTPCKFSRNPVNCVIAHTWEDLGFTPMLVK